MGQLRSRKSRPEDEFYTYSSGEFHESLDIAYAYDTSNNLNSRTTTAYTDGVPGSPNTTHFVIDASGNTTLAFVGSTLTDRYLSGPALDQVLADEQLSTDNTYWTAADNQDTIRDLLEYDSEAGTTVAAHLTCIPSGDLDRPDSTRLDIATVDFLFGYTGTWTDPATGLQYHSDPAIGIARRWFDAVAQRSDQSRPRLCHLRPESVRIFGNDPSNWNDLSGIYKACTTDVFIGHDDAS